MTELQKDASLQDPLSELTRKERRMLLGLSILGIAIVQVGIVPTKVTALGIDLASHDQQKLVSLFAAVVLYFWVAFFVYAVSDFIIWRKALGQANIQRGEQELMEDEAYPPSTQYEAMMEHVRGVERRKARFWLALVKPTSVVRAIFEFVLPLVAGAVSIFLLIRYAVA